MADKLGVAENFFTELFTKDGQAAPPRFPCSKCGKETKEHHPEERTLDDGIVVNIPRRICSNRDCRDVSYPTAKSE